MTDKQIPYFISKVDCPICGFANSFEIIKQGSYMESGRDTDFAPIGRVWKNPVFQGINPLLYFTGSCLNCHYTREVNSPFKEWKSDINFKTYRLPSQKKKHLNEIADDDCVIKRLGKSIDQKKYPVESSIIKLLLAIYDEKLMDKPTSLDIARFYIRIAWIYREINGGGKDESASPANMMLSKIQIEIDRLNNDVQGFSGHITPLRNMIVDDFDPVMAKGNDRAGMSSMIKTAVDSVYKVWNSLKKDVGNLQTEFNKVKQEIVLLNPDAEESSGFYEYPTFVDFLYGVKEKWQDVPVIESEALNYALQYYLKSYQNSREIKPGLQQIQASYMIGELSRRIGNSKQALEYFTITSKQAHEMMNSNRSNKTIFSNAQKILQMTLEQARLLKKPEQVKA